MPLLLMLVSLARADRTFCDIDGDHFDGPKCGGDDCDDFRPAVHPRAIEVPEDGLDQDCDGRQGAVRRWFDDLGSNRNVLSSGVTFDGDHAILAAGGWLQSRVWAEAPEGALVAIVDVTSRADSDCRVQLDMRAPGERTFSRRTLDLPDSIGTHALVASAVPDGPIEVRTRLSCTSGSLTADWISLQNATWPWPPAEDLDISWEGVPLGGGGAFNAVAFDAEGWWYAASDVAGVSKRDPADGAWSSANGRAVDFDFDQEQAIWDLWVDEDDAVWAIAGKEWDDSIPGGLFRSTDRGDNWELITDEIAAYGRVDDCEPALSSDPGPARAGGALIAGWDGAVVAANHVTGAEGVDLVELDGTHCALPDLPSCYAGALAVAQVGGADVLVVGMKGRGADNEGVFVCSTSSGSPACDSVADISCQPVVGSEGVDVRDLEVDPNHEDSLYVADGGRNPNAEGACTYTNGTVWQLDLSTDGWTEAAGLHGMLAGGNAQNVIGSELVGLTLDPTATWLLAIFPGGNSLPYTRTDTGTTTPNARIWRIPVADIGDDLAWEPTSGIDRTTRRSHVDLEGDWLEQQPDGELWAPAIASDAVFIPGTTQLVVMDGYGLWTADGILDDWTAADVDSRIDWTPALIAGDPSPPQATVVPDVALSSEGTIHAATNDLTYYRWAPGFDTADVSCVWNKVSQHGRAIDLVDTNDGEVVWLGTSTDSHSAIWKSEDDGQSWCFQGTTSTQDDVGYAVCKSATSHDGAWPACDIASSSSPGEALQGFGALRDIKGLPGTDQVAFATFRTIDKTPGRLAYTVDSGVHWRTVTGFAFDDHCSADLFFDVDVTIAVHPDSVFVDPSHYAFRLFLGGQTSYTDPYDDGTGALVQPCGIDEVVFTSDDPDVGTWSPLPWPVHCGIDAENLYGFDVTDSGNALWAYSEIQERDKGDLEGGICRVPLDGSASRWIARPATHRYDIGAMAAHPWVEGLWVTTPRVTVVSSGHCEAAFGAPCDKPSPFVIEARPWSHDHDYAETALPTDGLAALDFVSLAFDRTGTTWVWSGPGNGVAVGAVTW